MQQLIRFEMKRPNRIALIVPGLMLGGGVPAVARFVINTALRSQDFYLTIVSLSMARSDVCSVELRTPATWLCGVTCIKGQWEGLPFIHVGAFLGELEFQRYKRRKVLTSVLADCDLIQVVCGSPAWANTVIGLGKPVALQVATRAKVERRMRDAKPQGLSGWWRKAMTEITDRMDDRALKRVDAIQVENPWMFAYASKINAGREVDLRYAPPGIDAELFHPLVHRDLAQDSYILCVARLDDPRKNVGLLLDAYARLPHTLRNSVRLILAGSAGPSVSFWQRAVALGVSERVSCVTRPSVEVLVKLYQHASVFCLSSDEEGLGVVVLEAMACGVPVVATQCGGPDGIIIDGKDGYLVPLDDAVAMAARLENLLRDQALNLQIGVRARKTIERRYDQHVAGEVFVDMWERMLHKRRTL